MGYTTEFEGSFKINKQVDQETFDLLRGLASTRRMKRTGLDKKYGVDGEFYVEEDNETPSKGTIVNYNVPPDTQPGLWCQWLIDDDKQTIYWDGVEKFYKYQEWIKYFIKILKKKGYILNGTVLWQGEDIYDRGQIIIKNNKMKIKPLR